MKKNGQKASMQVKDLPLVLYKPNSISKSARKAEKAEMQMMIPRSDKGSLENFLSAPASYQTMFKRYYSTKPLKDGAVRVSGADKLALVPGDSNLAGSLYAVIPMAPLSDVFNGTRLQLEALRYEKYRFRKLRILWLPSLGTSTNGSIILAYDPDAGDNYIPKVATNTLQATQILLGFGDSLEGPLWTPFSCECKTLRSDPQSFFYTNYVGGDIRLAAQGNVYVASGSTNPSSGGLGSIAIEYEVDFFDPSLDQLNIQRRDSVTSPNGMTTGSLQGLNWIYSGIANNLITTTQSGNGQGTYPLQLDNAGNAYYSIPPGVHQAIFTTQNSTATAQAPVSTWSLLSNLVSQLGNTSVSPVDQFITPGSVASNTGYQKLKITSPPGGSRLYSTVANVANLVGGAMELMSIVGAALL